MAAVAVAVAVAMLLIVALVNTISPLSSVCVCVFVCQMPQMAVS